MIEQDVNQVKNFAYLRQIHSAVVLAARFKKKLKDSIFSRLYIDSKKTAGINNNDPKAVDDIYRQYGETFKQGVYNYVRKDNDSLRRKSVRRQYFSGGVIDNPGQTMVQVPAALVEVNHAAQGLPKAAYVNVDLTSASPTKTAPADTRKLDVARMNKQSGVARVGVIATIVALAVGAAGIVGCSKDSYSVSKPTDELQQAFEKPHVGNPFQPSPAIPGTGMAYSLGSPSATATSQNNPPRQTENNLHTRPKAIKLYSRSKASALIEAAKLQIQEKRLRDAADTLNRATKAVKDFVTANVVSATEVVDDVERFDLSKQQSNMGIHVLATETLGEIVKTQALTGFDAAVFKTVNSFMDSFGDKIDESYVLTKIAEGQIEANRPDDATKTLNKANEVIGLDYHRLFPRRAYPQMPLPLMPQNRKLPSWYGEGIIRSRIAKLKKQVANLKSTNTGSSQNSNNVKGTDVN